MTPRRLLLLVATLLVVQLGGLLHGLTHLGGSAKDHDHDGGPQAACEWCLAYAGLDHGVAGQPVVLPVIAPPALAIQPIFRPITAATHPHYRSRAPPTPLA